MQLGFLQFKRLLIWKYLNVHISVIVASRYECIYRKIRAEAQSHNLSNDHLLLARIIVLIYTQIVCRKNYHVNDN